MKDLIDLLVLLGHLLKPHPGRGCLASLARNALIMLGVIVAAALILWGCFLAMR